AVLQVSISLNKVELSVGESKFFTCTVIGEPVSINWFSPQGERIISNQRVIVHTEGVRSRLTIYNAIIEDAGIYRCQAVDTKGQSQEATVVLEIYQKLTFREVKTPQEFRQGEDAEVICDVISSPVPAVSWFYKNKEITSEPNSRFQVLPTNNLQILRVSKADEGVYRCEARVEARGEIDFRDIVVLVNGKSCSSHTVCTSSLSSEHWLTCKLNVFSAMMVCFHRKGHVIERSEQYVLSTLDGGKSTLTIKNIRQGDGGPYTCHASNKAGSSESQLFLKVFGEETFGSFIHLLIFYKDLLTWSKNLIFQFHFAHSVCLLLDAPKFQTNQTIFYSWEGNPVNISCDVKSNPAATMLWRRDRFTISSQGTSNIRIHTTEDQSLLEVTPVSDRDFGRYNCTARNNIGARYQEFILAQADVPSHPYSVRLSAVSQRLATVTFMKPDSHGGVPISYYIINYKDTSSQDWRTVRSHGVQTTVVLANLEPNTTYEVRVAAINGKGQGDFSHTETFQTLPIREPSPPTVHGQRGVGKAYRLGLIKQDDGGMPIVEYIVKYKTDKEEQWMTKLVPGMNDFALLQPLQWNTRYNVEITARNVKGLSEPTFFQFLMPQKPDITADSLFSGLGLGTVVGLGVAGLLLLLVLVDVSCFFLRQCGLLMCITRKLCSKKTTTSGKSKELEEGKAAYLVDGSKEPIVEMRTEEERITNQEDGSPVQEPNETTPLTEPEKLPLKEENGKEVLKPDLIEIKVHKDNSIHTKQDDSKA
uniref:Neural cell adhesion molecule 2 n=1 Tax=Cyprinus carpio TaxID=7962 RepID=A0A8C1XPW1_CYPCA